MSTLRLSIDDFLTGLLAALALRKIKTISLREDRFDSAVEASFNTLKKLAPSKRIDVRFRIARHPIHGDSPNVRYAISNAVQRDLISLDNPEYQDIRLKITPEDAQYLISRLPGTTDLYDALGEAFLSQYDLIPV